MVNFLAFFFTPIGRWIASGLAAFFILTGAYFYIYHKGAVHERATIEAAANKEADYVIEKANRAGRNADADNRGDGLLKDDGHCRDCLKGHMPRF